MSRLSGILLALLLIVGTRFPSVAQVPSTQIKVQETSGFLGMGGPRYMEIQLSSRERMLPLSDSAVNSGPYFFFLCRPSGDWQFDVEFVQEEIPKLSVVQGSLKYPIEWQGEFAQGDTTLAIGFPTQLRIHLPLQFEFNMDGTLVSATLQVPKELWPGYQRFFYLASRTNASFVAGEYRETISWCNQILRRQEFAIFPSFSSFRDRRLVSFDSIYAQSWQSILEKASGPEENLKERIAAISDHIPALSFVSDSLMDSAQTTGLDSLAAFLLQKAERAVVRSQSILDSLQTILDDRTVGWIFKGSVVSRTGRDYQRVIEALSYAFSSARFSDTSTTNLQFTIPPDIRLNLERNNLVDSYETFIRLNKDRARKSLPLLSAEFLANVRKDTASFSLPYYSMLQAVNDYYTGNFDRALSAIFRIFRRSYEPVILDRYDVMRVFILARRGQFPVEAVRLINEADQMDSTAIEQADTNYRQAVRLAPDFPYTWYSLGMHSLEIGDTVQAQAHFERAYTLDSLYISAYRHSYDLYRQQGNYRRIIEVLTRAIEKGNDYWETQFNLGLAFTENNDPQRAIQHYGLALALNPKSYMTLIRLGLAYQALKNYPKAREYFNNAINIDPLREEAVEYLSRLNELQRSRR